MLKKIIIIDRDTIRSNQLAFALSKDGLVVSEFQAGREALNHLLFQSVHAVILDYGSAYDPGTPVPDGKRLVREIVNLDAFVPLVLICDRCETLDYQTAAAADLVLRRPISHQYIIEGLGTVLGETLRERAQRKSGYIFAFR